MVTECYSTLCTDSIHGIQQNNYVWHNYIKISVLAYERELVMSSGLTEGVVTDGVVVNFQFSPTDTAGT